MIGRHMIRNCQRLVVGGLLRGNKLPFRCFSAIQQNHILQEESTKSSNQIDVSRSSIKVTEDTTPVIENATLSEVNEEELYKNKIAQEIIKEPLLEVTEPPEEIKAGPETPEKDKAFTEKKTSLWQKIKVALIHLKESFIEVWKDTKYLTKVVKANGLDENKYTLFEVRERRRITKDLIKFMPYAVLILVPGGELLFPPYFLLFPNSTPTQFMTVANLGERTKVLTEKQDDGYENFQRSLPKFAKLLGIDPIKLYESLNHLETTEGKEKDRQFYKAHDFEDKIQKFLKLKNKNELISPIGLHTLDSYELEQLNRVFYIMYVPGYTWINVIYGAIFKFPFYVLKFLAKQLKIKNPSSMTNNIFVKFKFSLDFGPLSYVKKWLLLLQLKYHLKQIRMQDRVLKRDFLQLAKNPILHKFEFARQRGIPIDTWEDIIKFTEYYWLPLSLREDVSDDLLVWITLLRFKYAEILI